jgi:hypothetical protein
MLYVYVLASLGVGVMSNFVRTRWSILASICIVFTGVIINSWRWLNWRNMENWGEALLRIVGQGSFWYLIPSSLFFFVPFLVGRYGYQVFERVVLRPARGD